MILDSKEIKNKALRDFYDSDGRISKGLQVDHLVNLRLILVHLNTAKSLSDIAEGLGKTKDHHKLSGYPYRYAMSVSGNYRIIYDCENPADGIVTVIEYKDYH